MRLCLSLLFVVCLLNSVPGCRAATYYVSTSGSDGHTGLTENAPFASLFKVNAVLADGDSVYLKRGDTWLVTRSRLNGETLGVGLYVKADNVTIGAYGTGPKPVIDATAQTDRNEKRGLQYYSPIQVGQLYTDDAFAVTITGLDLRGPALGCSLYAYDCGNGLTVANCDFRGAGWGGRDGECLIIAGSGENNLVFENNRFDQFEGNATGYSKSLEIRGGSGHRVIGNSFHGYSGGGALRFSDHGTGALVENNFIYGPDPNAGAAWALVIRSCNGGTFVIRNNVFDMTRHGDLTSTTDLRGIASWYDYAATTRLIYNNTFISSDQHGAAVEGMGGHGDNTVRMFNNIVAGVRIGFNNDNANLHLRNNVFYNTGAMTENGLEGTNTDNVITNPQLADLSMGSRQAADAVLTANSTNAIDRGTGTPGVDHMPTHDFNGSPRSAIDIGAFEYTGSSPQPPESPGGIRLHRID